MLNVDMTEQLLLASSTHLNKSCVSIAVGVAHPSAAVGLLQSQGHPWHLLHVCLPSALWMSTMFSVDVYHLFCACPPSVIVSDVGGGSLLAVMQYLTA